MAGSPIWGAGYHQGVKEGRGQGAAITAAVSAVMAVSAFTYSKIKKRQAEKLAKNYPEGPLEGQQGSDTPQE